MVTEADVRERLELVFDPCSVAMQLPMSIGDMGLVRRVDVDEGRVSVVLGVTTPMCHMVPFFLQQVDQLVGELPGVVAVQCEVDQSAGWTPEDMRPGARRRIDARYPARPPASHAHSSHRKS